MHFHQQLLLYFGILLEGAASGHSNLNPSPISACPNEIVNFTCTGHQVNSIQWTAEPYLSNEDPIKYVVELIQIQENVIIRDNFTATLTDVTNKVGAAADVTTTLTVLATALLNKTNITCKTAVGSRHYVNSTVLYIAGVPYVNDKDFEITFNYQEKFFIAMLPLLDMFHGGGVKVDHYLISVDMSLEVQGPIYNITLPYNATVSVNITAHNCAGYSDPLTLYIKEGRATGRPTGGSEGDHSTDPSAVAITVPVAVVCVAVIIIVATLMLFIYKHMRRSTIPPSSAQEHSSEEPYYDYVLPTPHVTSSHNPHSQIETSLNTAYGLGLSEVGASVHKQGHTQTTRECEGDGALPQTDANVAYGTLREMVMETSFHMGSRDARSFHTAYSAVGSRDVPTSGQAVQEVAGGEDSYHMSINFGDCTIEDIGLD